MKTKSALLVVIVVGLLAVLAAPAMAAAPVEPFYWTAGQAQVTVAQGDAAVFNYVVVNGHPSITGTWQTAQFLQIMQQDGRNPSFPALVTADLGALLDVYKAWDYPASVPYPLSATVTVDLPPGSYVWRILVMPWMGNTPDMEVNHLTVLPAH